MILIETVRLILRNVQMNDALTMHEYRNHAICARYQRGQTKDLAGIEKMICAHLNDEVSDSANFILAVEECCSGKMIGEIVVLPNDGCFSIGYTFHPEFHRRGYAFEALSVLTDRLHRDYPAMEFISFTDPENIASMALLKKLGYQDMGYEPGIHSQVFAKWLQGSDWR